MPARFRVGGVCAGVFENHAGQFAGDALILAGSTEQLCHIWQVHSATLSDGNRKCFRGSVHTGDGAFRADGTLGEQISLALQIFLLVQDFQRAQQKISAVLVERNGVAARVDESVFSGEGVVESIQLGLLRLDFFIGIVLGLIFQQRPHTVPQLDHAADSALCRLGYLHGVHPAVFTVVDLAVHQCIGKIADSGVGLDGMILSLQFFLPVISGDLTVDILNGFRQKCFQWLLRVRLTGGRGAERSGHHLHLAQDHIRVVDEITVHLDAVFIGGKMHPFRFYIHHSFPLLQKQDV